MPKTACKDCGTVPTVAVELCRPCYSRHHHAGTLPKHPTPVERFHRNYTIKPNVCWEWNSAARAGRYASFHVSKGRHTVKAHAYSYELVHGPIPAGAYVLHSCDNPPCVNPAHLRLGTHVENMQDAVDRHRWPRKLSATQVEAIKALKGIMTQKDIAAQFGVRDSQISRIFSGKRRSGKIQKLRPNS